MLSQICKSIAELDHYPDFRVYYQNYVKEIQDRILDNELTINTKKMARLKNFNCVLTQLNELTEELNCYEE